MPLRSTISVLLALGLLTGCGSPSTSPDAGTTGSASERLALTTRPGTDVLGPIGWRGLNLSMTQARAITTGLLAGRIGPPTPCQEWSTQGSDAIGTVYVSQRLGVAAIASAAGGDVQTPEGMTLGWTLDQVTGTYSGVSSAVQGESLRFVPVPNNPRARYRVGFDQGGKVSAITLELSEEDCYE
jgi:hypothetical protein